MMKKNTPVNYCRRGWKDKVLYVASHDEKAGTVDLANKEGEVLVTGCRYLADPAKETSLPDGYATGGASVDLVAPATPHTEEEAAKKAADEAAAKQLAEEEAAKKGGKH